MKKILNSIAYWFTIFCIFAVVWLLIGNWIFLGLAIAFVIQEYQEAKKKSQQASQKLKELFDHYFPPKEWGISHNKTGKH